MKSIERKMIDAVGAKKSISCGNTRVIYDEVTNTSDVFLFGNLIFSLCHLDSGVVIRISDCGYRTETTKSRLNALMGEFTGGYIYCYKGCWYLKNGHVEQWQGEYYIVLDNQHHSVIA